MFNKKWIKNYFRSGGYAPIYTESSRWTIQQVIFSELNKFQTSMVIYGTTTNKMPKLTFKPPLNYFNP